VEHVLALGGLAILLARLACELHREGLEDGFLFFFLSELCDGVRVLSGELTEQNKTHTPPCQITLLLSALSKGKFVQGRVVRMETCSSLLLSHTAAAAARMLHLLTRKKHWSVYRRSFKRAFNIKWVYPRHYLTGDGQLCR
jgi:hypothetical protein